MNGMIGHDAFCCCEMAVLYGSSRMWFMATLTIKIDKIF